METVPLTRVLGGVRGGPALRLVGDDVEVTDVTLDSRAVRAGALFCCVRGARLDGHDFAAAAVAAGAGALLAERELPAVDVAQVVTADTRAATGWLSASFFGHPSDAVATVGVTGTNGKTSTAHLIGDVLTAVGRDVDVFGTLSGAHTTPEAPEVQRRLAAARGRGGDAVVMEVSSHALELHRVDGATFDVAVFTNLGRDHLDLHGNVERYFAAKARLFTPSLARLGVVNVDDVYGRLLLDAAEIPIEPFSLSDVGDVSVSATRHAYTWRDRRVEVPLGGRFNVLNSLAAATACVALGHDVDEVVAALAGARPVPGRFETIEAGQAFAVVVDYAHTPDGLREVLASARAGSTDGRVLVVFGCGGDRDVEKRPLMGAVAAELADVVVVTSDNPRSEDPLAIIESTIGGIPEEYRRHVVTEPDRRAAITIATGMARRGDVVVIAGKGHEATQTIGSRVVDFDDRVVAREVLAAMTGAAS